MNQRFHFYIFCQIMYLVYFFSNMKKLFYLGWWFLRARFFGRRAPLQTVLFISDICNLRCKHCYRTEGDVETLSYEDVINVIDGCGSLYGCKIIECGKKVVCSVEQVEENFGAHGYNLTMAFATARLAVMSILMSKGVRSS